MIESVTNWLKKPYDDGMSVAGWLLFLGFVAVVSFAWSKVIREVLNEMGD